MKVLMTADAVGGVWTYAVDLSRALVDRGHEVVLATMGPAPDAAQRRDAAHATLVVSERKLEWMNDPWRDVDAAGDWLLALEREHAPDVVHLNGYAHATLPWRAPALVVAHSCVATWWQAVHGELPPPEYDEYRARVARGLAAARLVVAPTRALLDAMRPLYRFSAPTLVIPNGRDARGLREAPKEARALAVGRAWDEAKDFFTLDEAARGLPFPVDVVGDPRHPDGADARPFRHARALGRLPREALLDAYARAAVFAHPARYEAFGLAPVEAALSGCALVLSDLATLREVWGDAALYAPVGDAAAWRDRLRALLDDPARTRELAAKAGARAQRYSVDAMASSYIQVYSRLAQEVSASAS
ncbi:MAG TPA: glycosyltransferase family 4 protein [Candidatus Thermoplasmatota archaeon]|nr:glycosyltransferase family 4 protein [Candidatus Thermoplasmatota archaeon]